MAAAPPPAPENEQQSLWMSWREVASFIVAMTVLLGFFLLILFGKLSGYEQLVVGAMIGWASAAVQFYLGSSQGSTSKTGTIEKIAEKK